MMPSKRLGYGNFNANKETLAKAMSYLTKTQYILFAVAAIILIQGLLKYQATGVELFIGTHGFSALIFGLSGYLTSKQPLTGIWFSMMYYITFLVSDYRGGETSIEDGLIWKIVIFTLLITGLVLAYKGYNILKKSKTEKA